MGESTGSSLSRLPSRRTLFIGVLGFCVGVCFSYFVILQTTPTTHHAVDFGIELMGMERKEMEYHYKLRYNKDEPKPKLRVLCWIMTSPLNHIVRGRHVKATWGRRCDSLLMMSSWNDTEPGAVALSVEDGRKYLWNKTREAFAYIYKHHFDEADWFLKADDDTYVVVENLRHLLSSYDPVDPLFFGCRFHPPGMNSFMTGGAGYVLSKEAVRRFVEISLVDNATCRPGPAGEEDVEIGRCLKNVDVEFGETRDELGRGRFFQLSPEQHLVPGLISPKSWIWKYTTDKNTVGPDGVSDYTISFHYVSPTLMYAMEYFIYHLKIL